MASKKHYIITAITLGIIAASSGALIGLTNLITHNIIEHNKQVKVQKGIGTLFEGASSVEKGKLTGYDYVTYYYNLDQGRYAFQTSGSNMYGNMELLIGVENNQFTKLVVLTNGQTYNTTLEENYINPLNNDKRNMDDVSCGATYGAKLVRDMINDAIKASLDLTK